MKWKDVGRAAMLVVCIVAVAWAASSGTFELDTSGNWNTCSNWTLLAGRPAACYPSVGNDDAIIPDGGSTWSVDLVTVTIDDLTIEDSVDFGAVSGTPVLTVDSVTISGGTTTTTVATVDEQAKIMANGA